MWFVLQRDDQGNWRSSCICKHCGKMYKHDSSMYRHMKFECQGRDRKFNCTLCSASFKRKDHLLRHTKFIHRLPEHFN
ncbi:hypothetical protein JTB14_025586 [Gonioctena quinquepunctata]|nr:hypothetical protein JTB14_025586 [Gonioctena quinquepunctata]